MSFEAGVPAWRVKSFPTVTPPGTERMLLIRTVLI
jgi:hypothetical protein